MRSAGRTAAVSVFVLITLLSGCSSTGKLKPGESVVKKNRAAEYADFGSKYYDETNYEQALDFFFLALKQNILIDNDKGIIESYNSIGKTYLAAGKTNSAEEYFLKAMEIAEAVNDTGLIARCTNNTGEIKLAEGDYEAAFETFEKAYGMIEDPGKSDDGAIIMHNMGVAAKRMGKFGEAQKYLLASLEYNTKKEKFKEMAADYYVLASIRSRQSEYQDALGYINKALDLDKRTENSVGIAKDLFAKGTIQYKSGSLKEAYYTFKRDALILESLSMAEELIECLRNLEDIAKSLSYTDDIPLWEKTRKDLEKKVGNTPEK